MDDTPRAPGQENQHMQEESEEELVEASTRKAKKAKIERHRQWIIKTAAKEGQEEATKLAVQLGYTGPVPTKEQALQKQKTRRIQHAASEHKRWAIATTAAKEGQEEATKLAAQLGFTGKILTQDQALTKRDTVRQQNAATQRRIRRAITTTAAKKEDQTETFELALEQGYAKKLLTQDQALAKLDAQRAAHQRRRDAKREESVRSQPYPPPDRPSNDYREEYPPRPPWLTASQLRPQAQGEELRGPGPPIRYQQYQDYYLPGAPRPPAHQQQYYSPPAISPQQGAAGSAGNTDEQVARVRAEREQYWADRRGQGRGRGRGGQGHWDPNQDLGR